MTKNTGIYQIRNILDNKRYIGSAQDFKHREANHFYYLRQGTHHSDYLQNAYNKYGNDAFVFEILLFNINKEKLVYLEQAFIDCLQPEYNIAPKAGSLLGMPKTDEHKQKLRESLLGHKVGQETRKKISETLKGRYVGSKHPMFGKRHTEEARAKISKAHKGRKLSVEHKAKLSKAGMGNTNACRPK